MFHSQSNAEVDPGEPGPRGEDEIEAVDARGRRWYHLRPEPRTRADLMGFNQTWWTVLAIILCVSVIFPWW